jgi:hypothetical protein
VLWEGGLRGWVLGWQQVKLHTISMPTHVDCMQTGVFGHTPSHQDSSFADLFLRLLGVVYHLHFTAQQSEVPTLSCTPPKDGKSPCQFSGHS